MLHRFTERCFIPLSTQANVNEISIAINGAIQIMPFTVDPQKGFVPTLPLRCLRSFCVIGGEIHRSQSDTTRKAGGLMSRTASKAVVVNIVS